MEERDIESSTFIDLHLSFSKEIVLECSVSLIEDFNFQG
jgi:hypothetical protein